MASEPPAGVDGHWHAPASSRRLAATLSIAASGEARVEAAADGAPLAQASADLLELSERVGSVPRRVLFPDGAVFETRDNDGVDRLLGGAVRRGSRLVSSLEEFRPRLAVFVVLIVALSFAIYRYAVPVLVEVAVLVTPEAVPRLMSSGVLASLDRSVLSPSTLPDWKKTVIGNGFDAIAAHGSRGPDGYRLHFRGGGIVGANAFALPDGSIVLTDELVAMTRDIEPIIGVLGHEIGHVDRDHSLRRLYQAAGVAALIMMIGGDVGGGVEELLTQGSALVSLSYSRADETEADRYSAEIMHSAGRNPAAIADFFQMLQNQVGVDSGSDFFSTHPATAARIEAARSYAAEIAARQR